MERASNMKRTINEAKVQQIVNEEFEKLLKEEYELRRILGALGGGIGGLANGFFKGEPFKGLEQGVRRGWDRQNAKTYPAEFPPMAFFSNLYGNLVDSPEYNSRFKRYDQHADDTEIDNIRKHVENYSTNKKAAKEREEAEKQRREEEEVRRREQEDADRQRREEDLRRREEEFRRREEEHMRQQEEYWRFMREKDAREQEERRRNEKRNGRNDNRNDNRDDRRNNGGNNGRKNKRRR